MKHEAFLPVGVAMMSQSSLLQKTVMSLGILVCGFSGTEWVSAQNVTFPPKLPGGKTMITDRLPDVLRPVGDLLPGTIIAQKAPIIDFLYFPGQNYEGKPWSNWGDGCFANGKYYTAIGDHFAINGRGDFKHGTGTGLVFEYDPKTKKLRQLANTSSILKMPKGHYTPGKIHSRVDLGDDGWLYYATHRGSKRATTDAFHYKGDWIFRTNPKTGKSEVVAHGPVKNHSIPTSILDPKRLIFYGGTAAGMNTKDDKEIRFFAYDLRKKKMLYNGPNGPARYLFFSPSNGCVYFVPGNKDGQLMRFNPKVGKPEPVPGVTMGIRAATRETEDGKVYTVSIGQRSSNATIWEFDTKTETVRKVGTAAVGSQAYVASLDVGPRGRYLYYVPGAHGGGPRDGTPVVQYDLKTGHRKVLAFLHPYFQRKYGFTLKGTYSTALSDDGSQFFITFNVSRGSRAWDTCGLVVIHIPESERKR
ncbi:MAG: hypothetical protein Tsb009_13150 [Planctomycetaceae bacterium]